MSKRTCGFGRLTALTAVFILGVSTACCLAAQPQGKPWVVYEGGKGPGQGKHIVFVSGDEEYRSEEACPCLAKILAVHHGFKCTVLFAIDPETGVIDPNNLNNIPGLEALDDADLMVIFTRFRHLPDDQMKHIVDYVNSGRPVIGLRTATHAFNYPKDSTSPYAKWTWRSTEWPGGFGQQVLGDTWIRHHGHHRHESTRGVIAPGQKQNPIVRGAGDIWGPTDVYGIDNLTKEATVLIQGQVLQGMEPTDGPVEGEKNNPMQPIAWTKSYTGETGKTCKVFTTTMGAAIDLESEGLRRLLVNACYWAVGMEDQIPAKACVDVVGEFKPNFYGYMREKGFWQKKGVRPADLAL